MKFPIRTFLPEDFEDRRLCSFGITESIGAVIGGVLGGGALATGVGTGIAGAALGAGGGAALSELEGGKPGEGALFGALTGGAVGGLGPAIGSGLESATGLSAGAATATGDILAGAAGGTAGSLATGQSPLTGALEGAGTGAVAGLSGGAGQPSGPAGASTPAAVSPTAGATTGAGGAAAPGAVSLPSGGSATPLDPTSSLLGTDISGGIPASAAGPFTTASGAVPAAAGAATGGNFLDSLMGYLGNNPGLLLGGGLLGAEMLMGNKNLPAQNQVSNASASEASVGKTMESYAQSGTLPSGMQDIVNSNVNAGIAQVKSQYAALGLSGSTMEGQAIQQIREAGAAQTAQIAQQLFQQGAQFTGMSNQELNTLLQTQLAQETGLQSAIANFSGALAGARRPNTVGG